MTRAEIEETVAQVLAAQKRDGGDIEAAVEKAAARVLASFGIKEDDQEELAADFRHLRKWRKSVEQATSYTFKAVVTAIVGGFLGAIWLGLKTFLGK